MAEGLKTDTLVIGGGIAGLVTALSLGPKNVLLLCKGTFGSDASTAWAQGGIASALSADDSPREHCRDTLAVAGGIADPEIAALVTDYGVDSIQTLIDFGVNFDFDGAALSLRKEAAHGHRRIVHANGDSTGKEIMRALTSEVLKRRNIEVLDKAEAIDLLMHDKTVVGSAIYHEEQVKLIYASATVLATGGIGQLYSTTTNPLAASADGLAMAARAGACLRDLEFVQFHPTAIDVETIPKPLATEALRGAGAVIVNNQGSRFMLEEHPMAELAPRDILARGIWGQIKQGNSCYLDTHQSIGRRFSEEFPTVYGHCQDHGINPAEELIPIVPAAHYHMGGIQTNEKGLTSLLGLWACGEVACTGLHGANRLASNSLLEAIVFAKSVSKDIFERGPIDHNARHHDADKYSYPRQTTTEDSVLQELQTLNTRYLGLCRDDSGLATLIRHLDYLEKTCLFPSLRLKNIMLCSGLIAKAAQQRRESRGSHFRTDFPTSNPKFEHSTLMSAENFRTHISSGSFSIAS